MQYHHLHCLFYLSWDGFYSRKNAAWMPLMIGIFHVRFYSPQSGPLLPDATNRFWVTIFAFWKTPLSGVLLAFYWPLSPPPPPSSCDWWNCPRQSSSANRGRGIAAQSSSLGVPGNGWVATARSFPPPPPPLPNWDYRTSKLPLCWKAAFAQHQLVTTERGH